MWAKKEEEKNTSWENSGAIRGCGIAEQPVNKIWLYLKGI